MTDQKPAQTGSSGQTSRDNSTDTSKRPNVSHIGFRLPKGWRKAEWLPFHGSCDFCGEHKPITGTLHEDQRRGWLWCDSPDCESAAREAIEGGRG